MADEKINSNLAHLEIEISGLQEDQANARAHDKKNIEAISKSLSEFGQQKPIVALKSGKVVAGNGTLRAAKLLGWSRLAVVQFDSDDELKAVAYAIADNRSGELADWELSNLQKALESVGQELRQATGFSEQEFLGLLKDESNGELLDRLKVTIGEPQEVLKKNKAYHLGKHLLLTVDPIQDTKFWRPFLSDEMLFCPYPGVFVALTKKAETTPLLLVQPDLYIAGHICDRYKEVFPDYKCAEVSKSD